MVVVSKLRVKHVVLLHCRSVYRVCDDDDDDDEVGGMLPLVVWEILP
jgi:hypothetical protein